MSGRLTYRYRPILLSVAAILLAPSLALAQSPWERAASNLALTLQDRSRGPWRWSRSSSADCFSCSVRQAPSDRSRASSSAADLRCSQRNSSRGFFDRVNRRIHGDSGMPDRPTYRPVYKAIHRTLTVCGVDRRLFFLALILGAATFNLFYSFLAACSCSWACTDSRCGRRVAIPTCSGSCSPRQRRGAATTQANTNRSASRWCRAKRETHPSGLRRRRQRQQPHFALGLRR
jgi:hypothetical protein